jgi:hypothetical protein
VARQLPRIDRGAVLAAAPVLDVQAAQGSDLALVVAWLTRLHLLYGVPFSYLVPDERMLPVESLRFFQVDANWMDALIDGAYSLGFAGVSAPAAEAARPQVLVAAKTGRAAVRPAALARTRSLAAISTTAVSSGGTRAEGDAGDGTVGGFLLRSAVVSGWPGIEVRGYADAAGTQRLDVLRFEAVSPSILLCLFAGVPARVELREPAEALHFGVELTDGGATKELRYASGSNVGAFTGGSVPVPLRSAETGVVSVAALAAAMRDAVASQGAPFTSAEFALEMVEGVQVVDFQRQG